MRKDSFMLFMLCVFFYMFYFTFFSSFNALMSGGIKLCNMIEEGPFIVRTKNEIFKWLLRKVSQDFIQDLLHSWSMFHPHTPSSHPHPPSAAKKLQTIKNSLNFLKKHKKNMKILRKNFVLIFLLFFFYFVMRVYKSPQQQKQL